MTTKNLLVELLVEELPPKALKELGNSFSSLLAESLKIQGLASDESAVIPFASPRRLAVRVNNVVAKAADKQVSQKLMPVSVGLDANGQATPALLKRLAALGVGAEVVPQLRREGEGKAESLIYDSKQSGATLTDGLQKALLETLAKLPIPKVMTYQLADGWDSVQFVRPAHRLVALHDTDILPISILGLQAGRTTQGHRFEATSATLDIRDAITYDVQLENEGAVIPSFGKRRDEIKRQLEEAAAKVGGGPLRIMTCWTK
jgi:glycyl-tRNA synthetase beta chain